MAPEGRPTDCVVCGAQEYYNRLPHHNKWGAGTAYPVYSHATTLIEECGAVIIEGKYAASSIHHQAARDNLLRYYLVGTAVDNLGGEKELSDPTTAASIAAAFCEQLAVAGRQILEKAGHSHAQQAAGQPEMQAAQPPQQMMEARFSLPGGLTVGAKNSQGCQHRRVLQGKAARDGVQWPIHLRGLP
jgi:hypothetical protein